MNQNILDIITELADAKGRNAKKEILKREAKNNELKMVFSAALDPYKVFHIRKIPEYTNKKHYQLDMINAIHEIERSLMTRAFTGHKARDVLAEILSNLTQDDSTVLERVIKGDLKCGVGGSTVNEIWPKLIPKFPVMLCEAFSKKALQKITWPAYAQVKMDAMRGEVLVENGKVSIFSRSGRPIDIGGHLDKHFNALAGKQNIMFDGEIMVLDEKHEKYLSRKKGNGILNKASAGTISPDQISRIVFVLWDTVMLKEFLVGTDNVNPYEDRFNYLSTRITKLNSPQIRLVESIDVASFEEAENFYEKCISRGDEGIIIKTKKSAWQDKRSKFQIKMKAEKECELEIVGIYEGAADSKYVGKLGGFNCKSADGLLLTNVGGGFSDKEREEYYTENMIGRIITTRFNEVIESDGRETKSLYLGRLVELREDKDVANTLDEIMKL